MKILMDTNFLLIPFKSKIDVYEELDFRFPRSELFTLKVCVEELEKMKEHGAIALLRKKSVNVMNFRQGNVDNSIAACAEQNGFAVATIDRILQRKLRQRGLPFVFLRQNRFLELFSGKPLKNH
jgi:rRNA-processing protein FCF1